MSLTITDIIGMQGFTCTLSDGRVINAIPSFDKTTGKVTYIGVPDDVVELLNGVLPGSNFLSVTNAVHPGLHSAEGTLSKAAAFVVHPTPGVGDFTTIQAAVDALPAEGGTILLRGAQFDLTSSVMLPDKPVVIRGVGAGSSVINLGETGDFPAFTVQFDNPYRFELMTITTFGWATTGSAAVLNTSSIQPDIHLLNVITESLDRDLIDDGSTANFYVDSCTLTGSSVCVSMPNPGGNSRLWIQDSFLSTTGLTIEGPFGGGIEIRAVNCYFNGEMQIGFGAIEGCNISGPLILNNSLSSFPIYVANSSIATVTVQGNNIMIVNCTITDGNPGIDMKANNCVVASCKKAQGYTNPLVVESNPAGENIYWGCDLSDSTVNRGGDTINGVKLIKAINGAVTDNNYATILTANNPAGIRGFGHVKNIDGANTLTVRETMVDTYGTSIQIESDVLPGASLILANLGASHSTGLPPYLTYTVEIKDKVGGSHAAYRFRYSTAGVQ